MIAPAKTSDQSIRPILDKAIAGERLTHDEGVSLLKSHDLAAIGAAADRVSRRMHPESYRTYSVDRNINYTNVCTAVCDFCAFYRGPKSDEGYVLPRTELLKKIEETVALGGNQTPRTPLKVMWVTPQNQKDQKKHSVGDRFWRHFSIISDVFLLYVFPMRSKMVIFPMWVPN